MRYGSSLQQERELKPGFHGPERALHRGFKKLYDLKL